MDTAFWTMFKTLKTPLSIAMWTLNGAGVLVNSIQRWLALIMLLFNLNDQITMIVTMWLLKILFHLHHLNDLMCLSTTNCIKYNYKLTIAFLK